MWQTFVIAVGLVFIMEGLLPFLAPRLWRRMMHQMMMQGDRTLHIFGFVSMLIGLIIIYLLRSSI